MIFEVINQITTMKYLVTSIILSLVLPLLFTSCEKEITTGLEGIVYRGPINPVEIVGVPNDEPFEAGFSVSDKDGKVVATFDSDKEGRYSVLLAPGEYLITPDQDAPVIFPLQQSQSVKVGDEGFTEIDLYFDTGIR